MPIPHRYDRIKVLDTASRPGAHIILEDGTSFSLPPSARSNIKSLRVGDVVLLDLSEWGEVSERRLARVWTFRSGYQVTSFGFGEGCHLDIREQEVFA